MVFFSKPVVKGALVMPNQKHLTLEDRSYIQVSLDNGLSFRQIARHLDKDPSTISKEVRRHRTPLLSGAYGRITNRCVHKASCRVSKLCESPDCKYLLCRACNLCNKLCSKFEEKRCHLLLQPPYVCNSCNKRRLCVLLKYVYRALPAHKKYQEILTTSREGISYSESELLWMNDIITPLVKKKQSIHHICVTQADNILCSERTIYNLIEQGVFTVRNIDLPRKVRYRPRRLSKTFKVDKNCRQGRSYQDFKAYISEHPDTPVVQMDSVEGSKGGKVLLTIFFTQSDLMLMFLRERNTSQSVIDIFNSLDDLLGRETFQRLFQVILCDNGSEFSNPHAIEYDAAGHLRTRLFYCDPASPHQKPEIERNHEFIRMILPKGVSFNDLTQYDVNLMACHINSLVRKKLNDRSPITTFSFFNGELILPKLGISAIAADEILLSPALLTISKEVNKHEKSY